MSSGRDWGLHDPVPGPDTRLWAEAHHEHDAMSIRLLGFWLYMLSDSLVFAALFSAYEVLSFPASFAGGPTPRDVASPLYGYVETIVLFTSVLAYGLVMVQLKADRARAAMAWLTISLLLGLAFLGMETHELQDVALAGGPPQRSGFLSVFWTLVIIHGVHLAIGLLWMLVMLVQIARDGFTLMVTSRLANLKIYWLYQGLIWTFVYSFVYLAGFDLMQGDNTRPREHPEIELSNGRNYVIGYLLTLALLGLSLLLVRYHIFSAFNLLASISVLALLTTIAKLVLLFHLDFSETQRWNTLTLMLNVPLLILSIGLTSWMFQILYDRVMIH